LSAWKIELIFHSFNCLKIVFIFLNNFLGISLKHQELLNTKIIDQNPRIMEAKFMQSTRPASTTSSQGQGEEGWERLSAEDDDVESINSGGIGKDDGMAVEEENSKGSLFCMQKWFTLKKKYIPLLNKLYY
jgi:hypothetical protein